MSAQDLSEIEDKLNFCRVFEIPNEYPEGYCFGGGRPVTFNMVDWFQPIPQEPLTCEHNPTNWQECEALLRGFLCEKIYLRDGFRYVLITDFGESFVFEKSA